MGSKLYSEVYSFEKERKTEKRKERKKEGKKDRKKATIKKKRRGTEDTTKASDKTAPGFSV